jgi:hypothetical protein
MQSAKSIAQREQEKFKVRAIGKSQLVAPSFIEGEKRIPLAVNANATFFNLWTRDTEGGHEHELD